MWRKRPAAESDDDGMPELPGLPPRTGHRHADSTAFIARATDGHPHGRSATGRARSHGQHLHDEIPAHRERSGSGLMDGELADGAVADAVAETTTDAGEAPVSAGHAAEAIAARPAARPPRAPPSPTARALGLLSRREHSRRELCDKLVARGIEADAADAAIEQLGAAGWQSDLRYAESLFRQRRGAGYGPRYIAAELQARGVASAIIARAMGSDDGRDWVGIATDLLQRRLGNATPDAELRQRALALLLRRGFDNRQAREAFEQYRAG